MERSKTLVLIIFVAAAGLSVLLVQNRWKSATAAVPVGKAPVMSALPQEPISRETFLNEIFRDIQPPEHIARLIFKGPQKLTADSIEVIWKWSAEAGIQPLTAAMEADFAEKDPNKNNITNAARNLISTGSEFKNFPTVSAYMFQRGKQLIDKGMAIDDKNIPLRNALITYISEYENQPMKFLPLLRETLAMDSTNQETNLIHLRLLTKSGQWKKAIAKCEKLISLQPQSSLWLFQLSDVYGQMGDRENSRVYRDLAIKAQREEQKSH